MLETLPGKIDAMGRDIEKLRTALAEPDLYTRDRARFEKINALLAKMEDDLAKAEEEWLALEMKREEIEGSILSSSTIPMANRQPRENYQVPREA